jgi:acetyl-CoA carboxylase biotin carboxyl carrier protein
MNIREIKEMLQLMAEHDLAEMELEKEGLKIRFKKTSSGSITAEQFHQLQFRPMPMPSRIDEGGRSADAAAPTPEPANISVVKSPMVGTFYAAPAPDQPPYMSIGKQVKEGDVLCIVEAMKLMNEIKSEVSGTITEILVKNGQPVEFDQPLYKIQTA